MEAVHAPPPYLVGWLLGLLLGGSAAAWLLARAGLRPGQIVFVLGALVLSIVLGAKAMALLETWVEAPELFRSFSILYAPRMRIPGGFLLAALLGPIAVRVIGVPFLRVADAIVPAAGLCIAGIRFGCFLQGCCFGNPSMLPWAISFPPDTPTYWWQIQRGLLDPTATASLPVQPLQLYFGVAGLALFAFLFWYQKRRRYEGEVLLLFLLLYTWSTWGLELLRASPHATTRATVFVAALCATILYVVVRYLAPKDANGRDSTARDTQQFHLLRRGNTV